MLLTCVDPLELLHSDFVVVVVAKFKFRNIVDYISDLDECRASAVLSN